MDTNQRCTVCGYSAGEAAIVSIEGKDDQTFTELTDAWTYAANNSSADQPATVRLMLNAEISSGLEVSSGQNIILEMANGVALTSSGRGIGVMGGAFTLNSGKIYASGGDGISVTNGGTAHINGGDVTAKNCGVYANDAGTQVSIKGGSFSGKYAVQLQYSATAKIAITGGTFSSTGESSIVFFGCNAAFVNTMIPDGYFVYGPDGNSVSSSDLAVRLLTGGPFTVRACEHS